MFWVPVLFHEATGQLTVQKKNRLPFPEGERVEITIMSVQTHNMMMSPAGVNQAVLRPSPFPPIETRNRADDWKHTVSGKQRVPRRSVSRLPYHLQWYGSLSRSRKYV